MNDLVEWLREQLDDDERVARCVLAFGSEHYARGGDVEDWATGRRVNNAEPPFYDYRVVHTEHSGLRERDLVRLENIGDELLASHIARFGSPKRVLAEIEAKRRILDLHAESDFPYDPDSAGPGNYSWTAQCQGCYEDAPCLTVRLLAQPYAGRDGWREEWAA